MMENIADIIFSAFPQVIFEPVMILSLLGGICFLIAGWKKKTGLYYLAAGSLLFFYCWRVGIQIVSRRYGAFLISFCLILSVFFLGAIALYLPKKYWFRGFLAGIILLSGCCMWKLFRVNPYRNYMQYNVSAFKKDCKKYPGCRVYDMSGDQMRLQYYSGTEVTTLDVPAGKSQKSVIVKRLENAKIPVYIFLKENRKDEPLYKQIKMPSGTFEQVSSSFMNNRKKNLFCLYRYLPN